MYSEYSFLYLVLCDRDTLIVHLFVLYVSWCILHVSYMYLKQGMECIRIHTEYTTIHISVG